MSSQLLIDTDNTVNTIAPTPTTPTRMVLPGIVEPSGLKVETFAVTALGRHSGRPAVPFMPRFNIVGIVCDSEHTSRKTWRGCSPCSPTARSW